MRPGRWGDRRRTRIGLLGGSFNPAHAGHLHVAEVALARLGLDAVWLLVSPGNPLKLGTDMAPFAARLASARSLAGGRLLATDLEARLGEHYSERTLEQLARRFPKARFVFVIGADNLAQLPRWQRWRDLARRTAIAVVPRPGWTQKALAGQAARALRRHRRRPAALLRGPVGAHAPWCLIPAAEHPASATAIRAATRLSTAAPETAKPAAAAPAQKA